MESTSLSMRLPTMLKMPPNNGLRPWWEPATSNVYKMRRAHPLFRREWPRVYEALQNCRPDAWTIDATIHPTDVTSGTPSISGWIKILSGRLVAEFGRGSDKSNRDALAPKRHSKSAFERGSRIWAVEKIVDKLKQELLSDYLKLELKDQTTRCVLV